MKTGFASPGTGRGSARRSALVARIAVPFLMLIGMLATLAPSPTSALAQDGDTIPENVLSASVRISTNFLVTPENGDDPFLCMLDDDVVLEWSVGSGTIITEDGHILTNHHVTEDGRVPRIVRDYCEDQVERGDAEIEFTKIAWMPDERGIPENAYWTELVEDSSLREDLAILQMTEGVDGSRLPRNLPVVEFGDSDSLREPESIFIIGYPLNAGTSRRVSEGIFSGWGDNGYGVEWIYTDATISGGNSGGTAVNGDGLFVGVPTQATASDCRPGDTNNDGIIDEDDTGCIGIGGNYGILIPSNIAREFVEDALDIEIPVVGDSDRDDPDATEEPEPTEEPDDAGDGEMFGDITFFAYDEDEEPLDDFVNVTTLEACFENVGLEEGDEGTVTWFLDGDQLHVTEFEWDDDWNPVACASIWNSEEGVYLDAGAYSVELEANGVTATSDEVELEVDSGRGSDDDEDAPAATVAEFSVEAITTDGDSETPNRRGVLSGEFETLILEIDFSGMEEGAVWQVEVAVDGEVLFTSDPEEWPNDEDGSATVEHDAGRSGLPEGEYEVVLLIDDEPVGGTTFTIEA